MTQVPLDNTQPNQSFGISLNGTEYRISLRALDEIMLISIMANGETLITNTKCYANQPVILYPHLSRAGNFIFSTENNNYPYYTDFEKTAFLYYLTPQETEGSDA